MLARAVAIRSKKLPEPARSHQQRQIPVLGSVQISRSALRGRPEATLPHDVAPAPLQVEECTRQVAALIPDQLRGAPNAKLFLRSFRYRCLLAGLVAQQEMHLYTLSRCATASLMQACGPKSHPLQSTPHVTHLSQCEQWDFSHPHRR